MTGRAYHHGDLRSALLTEARRVLRERGLDGLSLRELAREAGVSHAAPRRHFADRQALLDALAEDGFTRLAEEVHAVMQRLPGDSPARLRAVADAYVEFATHDAGLLELMFTIKNTQASSTLQQASGHLFSTFEQLIREAQHDGTLPPGEPFRLQLLFVATLQGIAALLISGRITHDQVHDLVADALALLTTS